MTISRFFLAALVVTCLLASCAPDPSNPGASFAFVKAKVGSTYTFDYFETDSTGAVIPGSRDTIINTIAETGVAFEGRTDVSVVEGFWGSPDDTLWFACEANNDVSLSLAISSRKRAWAAMPINSNTPRTVDAADTMTESSVIRIERRIFTSSREGIDTIVIHGQSFPAVKTKLRVRTISILDGTTTLDDEQDLYVNWVPSLGYMSRAYTAGQRDPIGARGRDQQLLDYHLN